MDNLIHMCLDSIGGHGGTAPTGIDKWYLKEYDIRYLNKYNKRNFMQPILANYTASITELKKSPTQILEQAGSEAVAILNHNVASAYLVPSELYEKMMDIIDDYHLSQIVEERLNDGEKAIRVSIDDL